MDENTTRIVESRADVSVSNHLLFAAQAFIRSYLMDAHQSYIMGRTRVFEVYNVDTRPLAALQTIEPSVLDELAMNYARMVLSSNVKKGRALQFDINHLLQALSDRVANSEMADKFLLAGASNLVMKEFFGKRSKECCQIRIRLGIKNGRGRKVDPKGDDIRYRVNRLFLKFLKETNCPRLSLLRVHEETGHYIDFIHRVVQSEKQYEYEG